VVISLKIANNPKLSFPRTRESRIFVLANEQSKNSGASIKNVEDDRREPAGMTELQYFGYGNA